MKPQVLITHHLPEAAVDLVRQACEVQLDPQDRHLTPEALCQAVRGKAGLICLVTDRIDTQVLAAGKALKIVANVAAGYDNVDVQAATARGIAVTNTPGAVTDSTADFAWGLLFSIARRIPEADRYIRSGRWTEWQLMVLLGRDIHEQTLGIVGMGRIGQAVARRARGFGMRLLYHNRHRLEATLEAELGATWVPLSTLLQEADFVSLHVPLNDTTTHLIGAAELRMMRSTAYLINTARGPVVDEQSLAHALKANWIAGAALDVFEDEPHIAPDLLALENVVLAPHIGSASVATRTKMAMMAAQNLLAGLRGERPPNLVNPDVYG